jgi:hypothetical protein
VDRLQHLCETDHKAIADLVHERDMMMKGAQKVTDKQSQQEKLVDRSAERTYGFSKGVFIENNFIEEKCSYILKSIQDRAR